MVMWQPGITLEDMEKQVIFKALSFYKGDRDKTATALGVTVRTIYNKLQKYREQDEAFEKLQEHQKIERDNQLLRARGLPVHVEVKGLPVENTQTDL